MSWLREAIESGRAFALGEISVEPAEGGWRVVGPHGPGSARRLRADEVRAHCRFDDSGRYRPLSGARTLPREWYVEVDSRGEVEEVIEAIYPLAVPHIEMAAAGTLRRVALDEVLGRQSGRYEEAAHLSAAGKDATMRMVCGTCVRTPAWNGEALADGPGTIPCPEACSVLVSFCREAAAWERDAPVPADVEATAGYADFAAPGNALRVAFLGERSRNRT